MAVLGHCASLSYLHLGGNGIGAEGMGRLGVKEIGDEGSGRRSAVLGQCASLAHHDLNMFTYKYIHSDTGNCQAQRVQYSFCVMPRVRRQHSIFLIIAPGPQ